MEKHLTPLINVRVKMPKKMMHELNLFETKCVMTKVRAVSIDEVKAFLLERNDQAFVDSFKPEYLHSVPETLQ